MTCKHVLALIDAGPFADSPRAHLDAAVEHARHCSTCGPALATATALAADLAALPRPAPPPHLAATVMARLAQIEPADHAEAAAAVPKPKAFSGVRDWSMWAMALGGLAAGIVVIFSIFSVPIGDATPIGIPWPGVRGLETGLVSTTSTMTGTVILGLGLALYIAGLFAPIDGSHRQTR